MIGASLFQKIRSWNIWKRIFLVMLFVVLAGLLVYVGWASIAESFLSDQAVIVIAEDSYRPGSEGGIRVFALHEKTGEPLRDAEVSLRLLTSEGEKVQDLSQVVTDETGSAGLSFFLPSAEIGNYQFEIAVDSSRGSDTILKKVILQNDHRFFLLTDRLLYKPGQTVLWRALALDAGNYRPSANLPMEIAFFDAENNQIFRKSYTTSKDGIISDALTLAEELNTGNFRMALFSGNESEERNFEVKPFTLPKFSVEITTDAPYYLPGDTVSGEIRAEYFFGEPVSGATISLKNPDSRFGQPTLLPSTEEGVYPFSWELSSKQKISTSRDASSKPMVSNNKASDSADAAEMLLLPAEVIDPSNNFVSSEKNIPFYESPIILEMFPDGNVLKPNLPNDIYVLATYPDGTPASLTLRLTGDKTADLATNEQGIASFRYTPADYEFSSGSFRRNSSTSRPSFILTGIDENGGKISKNFSFSVSTNDPAYLTVRPEQILFEKAEPFSVNIESTEKNGVVFVDVIQNDQLKGTFSATLTDGYATVTIPLDESFYGTLQLSAYQFVRGNSSQKADYRIIRETRLAYVNAPIGLDVKAEADRSEYLPGKEARVTMNISDENGKPMNAVFGMKVVDSAMRALDDTNADTENFSKRSLLLSPSFQNPLYEVNGITLPAVIGSPLTGMSDTAARAIFSAFPISASGLSFDLTEHGKERAVYESKRGLAIDFLVFFAIVAAGYLVFRLFFQGVLEGFQKRKGVTWAFFKRFLPFFPVFFVVMSIWGWEEESFSRFSRPDSWELLKNLLEGFFDTWETFIENFVSYLSDQWSSALIFGGIFAVLTGFYIRSVRLTAYKKWMEGVLIVGAITFMLSVLQFTWDGAKYSDLFSFASTFFFLVAPVLLAVSASFLSLAASPETVGVISWGFILLSVLLSLLLPWGFGAVLVLLLVASGIRESRTHEANEARFLQYIEKKLNSAPKRKNETDSYFQKLHYYQLIKKFQRRKRGVKFMLYGAGMVVFSVFALALLNTMLSAGTGHFEEEWSGRGGGGGGGGLINSADFSPELIISGRTASGGGLNFDLDFSSLSAPQQKKSETISLSDSSYQKEQKEIQAPLYVRKYFPEVMYFNPAIIAENGKADVILPLADSITTWRLSAFAHSFDGKIGAGESDIRVFQDFFLDLTLPDHLTEGDTVSLPVTLYNYLNQTQDITLTLHEESGFTILSPKNQAFSIAPQTSKLVYVDLRADAFGDYTLQADIEGESGSDAIAKPLHILPFGRKIETVVSSDLLQDDESIQVTFPKNVIAGTEKIILRLYPSYFSQIVEGLDSLLRFPSGCFEQTSSSLYPNILVLQYLRETQQSLPDIEEKALSYIEAGFQKLFSYEVSGEPGGFSLFGNEPAETLLTAYGLMEFSDLSKVFTIDPDLIPRTKRFLYSQQNTDGTFESSKKTGEHRGGFTGGTEDTIAKTAYITWGLASADPNEGKLKRSIEYLKRNIPTVRTDPYALSLIANALSAYDPDDDTLSSLLDLLLELAVSEEDALYFQSVRSNYFGSQGQSGNIETTALAAMAFQKSGLHSNDAIKMLKWLISVRDPRGSWGSTQATILALKALVAGIDVREASELDGEIAIYRGDLEEPYATLSITKENSLLSQLYTFAPSSSLDTLRLVKTGDIRSTYLVSKEYYIPWEEGSDFPDTDIDLITSFDDTSIDLHATVQQSVLVLNKGTSSRENVIVRVNIPPGFQVLEDSLQQALKQSSYLKRYQLRSDAVYFYLRSLPAGMRADMRYSLRALYPVEARVSGGHAYDYYNPFVEDYSVPEILTVLP